MNIKFQKQLINISLKAAKETKDKIIKDIFLTQAARLEEELKRNKK